MDIGTTLNVVVSLFFLFLILNMIMSVFQEMVVGAWNSRGQGLKAAIGQLLGDPEFIGLAKGVYNHRLVAGLVQPGLDLPALGWIRRLLPVVSARLPSYIPKETFADAGLDIWRRGSSLANGSMQPAPAARWEAAGKDEAIFRVKLMDWYVSMHPRRWLRRDVQRPAHCRCGQGDWLDHHGAGDLARCPVLVRHAGQCRRIACGGEETGLD